MEVPDSGYSSRAKFQTIFIIAGKITAMLATFAVPLVLIRLLSKSEYGIFAQFYVIVFLCTGFFSLSVHSNLYFFYPTASEHKRKSLVAQTLLFLIFVAIVAIVLLNIPFIGNRIIGEGDLLTYKNLIISGIILFMPILILEPLYVVKTDIITSLLYPPAEVILRLSLVIGLVLIRPGLNSVFTGILISAAVCFLFVTYYISKEIGIKNIRLTLFDKGLAKQQLMYSIPFGAAVSLNLLFLQYDKIICISFLTPADFAIYAISFYGIPGVLQVFDSLSQVYLIKMTVKFQENKIQELATIYKTLVTKTFSFSFPAILIVMLYAEKIIVLLFTRNYIDSVPLFRAYLLSVLVFMLSSGLILRATGKTSYTLRSYLVSSIVIFPLTYILIKNFGMWGAMTGALVSISLPRFINLAKEISVVNSNVIDFFPWKEFGKISLISCISILPFLTMEYFFDYSLWVTIMLGILYIVIVAVTEIKFNLFPFELSSVLDLLTPLLRNFKIKLSRLLFINQ
jgi:O-antigen/teichoic acid export membrane protein